MDKSGWFAAAVAAGAVAFFAFALVPAPAWARCPIGVPSHYGSCCYFDMNIGRTICYGERPPSGGSGSSGGGNSGGGGGDRWQQGLQGLQGILGTLREWNQQNEQRERAENNRLGREAEREGVDYYNSGQYEQALYAFQRGYQYFARNGEARNMAVMENHINAARQALERKRHLEETKRWEEQHKAKQAEREQVVKDLFSPSSGEGGRENPFGCGLGPVPPDVRGCYDLAGGGGTTQQQAGARGSDEAQKADQSRKAEEARKAARRALLRAQLARDPATLKSRLAVFANAVAAMPPGPDRDQMRERLLEERERLARLMARGERNLSGESTWQRGASPFSAPKVEAKREPQSAGGQTPAVAAPSSAPSPRVNAFEEAAPVQQQPDLRPRFPSEEPPNRQELTRPECRQSDEARWAERAIAGGFGTAEQLILGMQDLDRRRKLGCFAAESRN
ncbi:MAG TPA: hypothetical protein VNN77_00755 [candidate division Zixibacteria bacterium]|nr:hypothetical protein [candidate division Zixibacteria bacterium]